MSLTITSLPPEIHRLVAFHCLNLESHVMNLAHVNDHWYDVCDAVVAEHYHTLGLVRLSQHSASRYRTRAQLIRLKRMKPWLVLEGRKWWDEVKPPVATKGVKSAKAKQWSHGTRGYELRTFD